jgi:hypothetical protein
LVVAPGSLDRLHHGVASVTGYGGLTKECRKGMRGGQRHRRQVNGSLALNHGCGHPK